MRTSMIDLKKVMIRNLELEEEIKSTCDGYEEEITILVEKNDDLTRKLGVFMGDPAPGGDDDHPDDIRSEDYIITDDTDSDPDSSDDDYEDEARAKIMGVFHRSKFLVDHHIISSISPMYIVVVRVSCNGS